jgi:hypothetical protein
LLAGAGEPTRSPRSRPDEEGVPTKGERYTTRRFPARREIVVFGLPEEGNTDVDTG